MTEENSIHASNLQRLRTSGEDRPKWLDHRVTSIDDLEDTDDKLRFLQSSIEHLTKRLNEVVTHLKTSALDYPNMRIYCARIEYLSEHDELFSDDSPGVFWIDDASCNECEVDDEGDGCEVQNGIFEARWPVMAGPMTIWEILDIGERWSNAAVEKINAGDFRYLNVPVLNESFFNKKFSFHKDKYQIASPELFEDL